MTDAARAGVVLAGGYSTRFGDGDKALADVAGRPMVRVVADRLARATDALVVNCRADQRPALEATLAGRDPAFAEDPAPGRGPLAGAATGLRAVPDGVEYAALVACDMPLVDPDVIALLFERARGRAAAVPRVDGRSQPAQAVYRVGPAVEAFEAALSRGESALADGISGLDCAVVPESAVTERGSASSFENVNTRTDLAAVAERVSEGRK